jgi:GlpG protein
METATDDTSQPAPLSADARKDRQRFPILTWLACAGCVVVFVGLMVEPKRDSWEGLQKWGYHSFEKILDGAFWSLVTSTFVHLEFWHLAFNLYWLWVLGSRLERAIGSPRWLAFFLIAAVVSSGIELLFAGDTGFGASGVGYALFGFMWMARGRYPRFVEVLDQRTILLFVVWLFLCVGLTIFRIKAIGNYAHFAGLALGAGVGAWVIHERWRRPVAVALAVLIIAALLPLVWAPWSPEWTSRRAFQAHQKGDLQTAVKWYERSLRLGADKLWCWSNLAIAYDSAGDEARRDAAIRTLRGMDEGTAREVERTLFETLQSESK